MVPRHYSISRLRMARQASDTAGSMLSASDCRMKYSDKRETVQAPRQQEQWCKKARNAGQDSHTELIETSEPPPCYPVTAHPPKLTRTASASATAEHQRTGFGGSSGLSIQKPPCLVCPAYHLQAEEQMAKGTEQETETEVSPAPIACHRWDDKSLGKFWQAGLWEISNTAC